MRSGEALEGILQTDEVGQATDVFLEYLGQRGFQNLIVGNMSYTSVLKLPDGWWDYYATQGLHLSDPVWRLAKRIKSPHTWNDLEQFTSNLERRMMQEAESSGLRSGMSVPIFDSMGIHSNISISSKDKGVEAEICLEEISSVGYAYSVKAFQPDLERQLAVQTLLTPRERECVQWAAAGKTYNEISEILSISHRTVVAHVSNAMDKYGAPNISSLCVMALMSREIDIPG